MAMAHQPLSGVEHAAKSIIALINGQPRSPTESEIAGAIEQALAAPAPVFTPVSDLGRQIRGVVRTIMAHDARLIELDERTPQHDACQARIDACWARLEDLTAELPTVPRTFADLLTIGEVAWYWADKDDQGRLCELESPCPNAYWSARLTLAIVAMGGRQHA